MSSATSIKADPRVSSRQVPPAQAAMPSARDDAFRPWHFFVLMSLLAATTAVVMTPRATPEHLILVSLTIGAAGFAAAAFYRMLAPLAKADAAASVEPLSERTRAALEREKTLVLRSIKELEFDRAMGKVSPKDFDEMAGRLRARALALMKQLDEGGSAYRDLIERELRARVGRGSSAPLPAPSSPAVATTASPACASCGASNDVDALFCKRCGTRLETAP